MTRVDEHTVEIVNKKSRGVVGRMRIVVAADGKSRTNTVMDPSGKTTALLLLRASIVRRDASPCRATERALGRAG